MHTGAGHQTQDEKRMEMGVYPGRQMVNHDGNRKKVLCSMTGEKLKDIRPGTLFTRKPTETPTEAQVFIRREYDRTEKRYFCQRWADIADGIMLKGETIVYTDFTF